MAPDRRPTSAKRTDPMFKRPSNHYGRSPEPVTPYQRAAQVWDDRIGSARVQAKNWRFAFFGALLISGGLAGGLVWQAARGTITPWVRSEEHTSELQSLMRTSYAVFCLN